jgi:hypothetical protein
MALGCGYCRTRERFKEWLLRLHEVKALRRDIKETQVLISALRSMAQYYYKQNNHGLDTRTFEEVLKDYSTRFEMIQKGIIK